MNIRSLVDKGHTDTEVLKQQGKFFNDFQMYDKNFQLEVSKDYFEIFDNAGEPIIAFSTNDVVNVLKTKKII